MSQLLTVAGALAAARAVGIERFDAQTLLSQVLGRPRAWLLAHDETVLDTPQTSMLRDLMARAAAGEPLAYLVGEQGFHGLTLAVDANVLVPRPDTEVLVDWALEWLDGATGPRTVIDLGTGSGAIAIAVAVAVKQARHAATVTATDLSAAALVVARGNASRLGADVDFCQGSWWTAAGTRRFDLALSNPPYIAGDDPHLVALRHEPALALSAGGDGLQALRDIVRGAPAHLVPGGWLMLEHGHDQGAAVQALFGAAGFDAIETRHDLAGRPRCTGGRLMASAGLRCA